MRRIDSPKTLILLLKFYIRWARGTDIYRIAVFSTTILPPIASCCLHAKPRPHGAAPRDQHPTLPIGPRACVQDFRFRYNRHTSPPVCSSLFVDSTRTRHSSDDIIIIHPRQVGPRENLRTAVVVDDAIVSLFVDLCHDGVGGGGGGGGGSGSNTPRINTRPRRRG